MGSRDDRGCLRSQERLLRSLTIRIVGDGRCGDQVLRLILRCVRVVDHIQSRFLQKQDNLIDECWITALVGQVVMNLPKGHVPLLAGFVVQFLQLLVKSMH